MNYPEQQDLRGTSVARSRCGEIVAALKFTWAHLLGTHTRLPSQVFCGPGSNPAFVLKRQTGLRSLLAALTTYLATAWEPLNKPLYSGLPLCWIKRDAGKLFFLFFFKLANFGLSDPRNNT